MPLEAECILKRISFSQNLLNLCDRRRRRHRHEKWAIISRFAYALGISANGNLVFERQINAGPFWIYIAPTFIIAADAIQFEIDFESEFFFSRV